VTPDSFHRLPKTFANIIKKATTILFTLATCAASVQATFAPVGGGYCFKKSCKRSASLTSLPRQWIEGLVAREPAPAAAPIENLVVV